MTRNLLFAGLIAASVLASGCTFTMPRAEETSTVGSLDRAEAARARAERTHPACRDNRADRDDQNDGCSEVVRRR